MKEGITMKLRKAAAIAAVCALIFVALPAAADEEITSLPRNETLYFNGMQYGTINSFNLMGSNQNNGMVMSGGEGGYRTLMFETLYMYNPIDGSLTGLLADGDYKWNDDMTELSVKIKDAAKWSDGTPVTAYDVQATWDVSKWLKSGQANGYKTFVDRVEAVDDKNLIIYAVKRDSGEPLNPLKVLGYLSGVPTAQKAWLDKLIERNDGDQSRIIKDIGLDIVGSGPYKLLYYDNQKIFLIRDDNYWGQDPSMWGKLPVPRFIAHVIFADNAAGDIAFKMGNVDVSQNFISNVQNLWLNDHLPVSTYDENPPYGVCLMMPTAWFNLNIPVLREVNVRKAIAYAVDYDQIIASAMTNQSPTFKQVPRSLMNPTPGEQAMYDHDAVRDLQWEGNDIEGAKKLLDEAGIVDNDGDGWREYDGKKISLNAVCPQGWSDWQAAMEIVAAAGAKIGIEITTLYPISDHYSAVYSNPHQTEYAIFMVGTSASGPSQPLDRIYNLMSGDLVGMENNWTGNYGQYLNPRADELLNKIPLTKDKDELKKMYTELVRIYLTDVPSFSLMYRPAQFFTVNESVWTNFPSADDGRNIPPLLCTDGYGIRALYELKLVNPEKK